MDNTKIFIDIDDEITFIAERVLSSKTQNVILVIPERASILSSLASLKLLNYVVGKSGKKIVLVTMDDVGKILAQKAGFETRNRVGEVEADIWNTLIVDSPDPSLMQNTEEEPGASVTEESGQETIEEVVEEVAKELEETQPVVSEGLNEPEKTAEPEVVIPQESVSDKIEEAQLEIAETPEEDLPVVLEESPQEVIAEVMEEVKPEEPAVQQEMIPEEHKEEESTVDREISITEMKDTNPSIYDIVSPEKEEEKGVEEVIPKMPQKLKYVDSVRIVKLDGFDLVVGGDAAVIKKSKEIERKVVEKKANTIASFHHSIAQSQSDGIIGQDIEANVSKKKPNLVLEKIMKTLGTASDVAGKHFKKWMLIPIGIVLAIVLILSVIFLPTATLSLTVDSKSVSSTNTVKANINNPSVDISNMVIPAYLIDVNESSSSSLNTTGSKQVGSPATGPVIFYNNTTNDVSIPQGTVLITNDSNAYKFTTDSGITVKGTNGQPSSQTVNVTASDIGSAYNIPANTPFIRSGTALPSGVTAVSNATFQGGTSSTAQVVAQADQDNLLKSLEQQLQTKADSDLNAKLTDDMIVVKDSKQTEDVTKSFDSNVGDKASILNLSLTIKESVVVYKKTDLMVFAKDELLTQAKNHETIKGITDTTTYNGFNTKSGDVTLSIASSAQLTPTLNAGDIAKASTGKFEASVQSYLTSLEGVKHAQIAIHPFWYALFHFLPTRVGNIQVSIVTK